MPEINLKKLTESEKQEFDALSAKDIDELTEQEADRLGDLLEAAGARRADQQGGEKTPVKQGSSDAGKAGEDDDEDDLSGSVGDEDSFEAQQKNLAVGAKATAAADGGKKRPADKSGGETSIIKGGTPVKAEDIDLSGDFGSLFEDGGFDEKFRTKVESIFKSAVVSKINEAIEQINKDYQEKLTAAIKESKDALEEQADTYLSSICQEWMQENEVAIENGIRSEISESFITGLKGLFEQHYIEVPETKVDIVSEVTAERDELKTKLDEAMATIIRTKKEQEKVVRESVVREVGKTLSETQQEKLEKLAEGLDFEDKESFSEKVEMVMENYFPKKQASGKKPASGTLTEDVNADLTKDDDDDIHEQVDPEVRGYMEYFDRNAE